MEKRVEMREFKEADFRTYPMAGGESTPYIGECEVHGNMAHIVRNETQVCVLFRKECDCWCAYFGTEEAAKVFCRLFPYSVTSEFLESVGMEKVA